MAHHYCIVTLLLWSVAISVTNGKSTLINRLSVPAGWCEWSEWSDCNYDYALNTAIETRTRKCECPVGHDGGAMCVGDKTEQRECTSDYQVLQEPSYVNEQAQVIPSRGDQAYPSYEEDGSGTAVVSERSIGKTDEEEDIFNNILFAIDEEYPNAADNSNTNGILDDEYPDEPNPIPFDTMEPECIDFYDAFKGDVAKAKKCCKTLNTWSDAALNHSVYESLVKEPLDTTRNSEYDSHGSIITNELIVPKKDAVNPGIADLEECLALGENSDAPGPWGVAERSVRQCPMKNSLKHLRTICCVREHCHSWGNARIKRFCYSCRAARLCTCYGVRLSG